jgi:hypothetical protein
MRWVCAWHRRLARLARDFRRHGRAARATSCHEPPLIGGFFPESGDFMQKITARRANSPFLIDTLESRTLLSASAGPAFHADVLAPSTRTALFASSHVATLGRAVTLTVLVRAAHRFGTPAGTVELLDNGNPIQALGGPLILTLSAKGRASYDFATGDVDLYLGKHRISAEFISSNSLPGSASAAVNVNIVMPRTKTGTGGIQIASVKPGHGKPIAAGQMARIVYTGFLQSTGAIYNYAAAHPPGSATFNVGEGQLGAQGFDDGILGMRIGETRVVFIPSALGYGPAGAPPAIPGNADLVFLVTLLDIS